MGKKLKNLVLIILIILVIVGIGFLITNAVRSVSYNKNAKNPVVTLSIEGYGDVQIELYPDYAPNTVSHIVNLVQKGFYNGKIFYGTDGTAVNAGMILEDSTDESTDNTTDEATESTDAVVEGDNTPEEDPIKASLYDSSIESGSDADYNISVKGEFVANGFDQNTMRFEYGTVGLYRNDYQGYWSDLSTQSYNSGTSLFFILTKEDSTLNGMYTPFGKVISGMDIIEQINSLPTQENEDTTTSTNNIKYFDGNYPVITSATVETYGIDYKTPEYQAAFDYDSYVSNVLRQYYSSSSN